MGKLHGGHAGVFGLVFLLDLGVAIAGARKDPFIKWTHRKMFMGVHSSGVKLCVAPHSRNLERATEIAKQNASFALRTWLGALKTNDATVNDRVIHTCSGADYTVDLHSTASFSRSLRRDLRAFVFPNQSNHIQVHAGALSAGLFLHEFGHAFAGLGDTYVEGGQYNCKEGFPASIMCSHFLFGEKLLQADRMGLRDSYSSSYSSYLLKDGFDSVCLPWLRGTLYWVEGRQVPIAKLQPKASSVNFANGFPSVLHVKVQNESGKKEYVPWNLAVRQSEALRRFREKVEVVFK